MYIYNYKHWIYHVTQWRFRLRRSLIKWKTEVQISWQDNKCTELSRPSGGSWFVVPAVISRCTLRESWRPTGLVGMVNNTD